MPIRQSAPSSLPMTGNPSKANAFDANQNFYLGSGTLPPGGALNGGVRNFLWGSRAGGQITTASDNIAMGLDAALWTTSGGSTFTNPSVYLGYTAGKSTSEGGNVGIGMGALGGGALASGGSNLAGACVAVGEQSLYSVTASQKDTAVGSSVLTNYIRGGQNAGYGRGSGFNLVEGSYNLFAGHGAALYNVYSTESVALGDAALNAWNASAPLVKFTGSISGTVLTVSAVSSGTFAVGMSIMSVTATGLASVAQISSFGTGSGTTGTYNLSANLGTVTSQAMWAGPGGTNNIAIGQLTGPTGYNDSFCIAIGDSTTTGAGNHRTSIGAGQTAAHLSGNFSYTTNPASVTSATGAQLTAAQISGHLLICTTQGAVTYHMPTAASIVAAIPGAEVGATIDLEIINKNTGTLTMGTTGSTGVTLQENTTVAQDFTRRYKVRVTNATASSEAVLVYGLGTSAR